MDGRRRLLAATIGAQESEASWADLMRKLTERGLSGVKLVIADDRAGLKAGVRAHLRGARQQPCMAHLQRDALDNPLAAPWARRAGGQPESSRLRP